MKIPSAHRALCKSAVLAPMVCFVMQGCGIPLWAPVKTVPVQEVDAHGISLARVQELRRGDRAESVIVVLGAPADRRPSCVPGEVVWRYPIRAWNDMLDRREVVPAVLLRLSFDASGTLTEWSFVDSLTGRPLPAREKSDDASRWFQTLSLPPIPPRIELAKALIPGHTTQFDVERVLGQWQPDLYCGNGGPAPVVKKTRTESGFVWDWYVDRPSSLFVPPHYLVVSFDNGGSLIVWHFEQTYPGGRK